MFNVDTAEIRRTLVAAVAALALSSTMIGASVIPGVAPAAGQTGTIHTA